MADPRFFARSGPFSVAELAAVLGCTTTDDEEAATRVVMDVGALSEATSDTLSFLTSQRYLPKLSETSAGAVLLQENAIDSLPPSAVGIVSKRPYYDFARASQQFYPEPVPEPRRHPTAFVDDTASVGGGVRLDPGAMVSEYAVIGDGVWIGPNAVVDRGVTIGAGSWIGATAYVGFADLGEHCRIHPGVRIGTRGFGFAMNEDRHLDIPQIGRVQIGNFVEIGANSTIDRGMGPDTVVGDGTKIDNLVQIGHNVRIGRGCVVAAQAGLAGSAILQDFVACGAQSGVAGHLTIGTRAQLAAKCGVIKNIEPGSRVGGLPAVPLRQWLRRHAYINRLIQKTEDNDA